MTHPFFSSPASRFALEEMQKRANAQPFGNMYHRASPGDRAILTHRETGAPLHTFTEGDVAGNTRALVALGATPHPQGGLQIPHPITGSPLHIADPGTLDGNYGGFDHAVAQFGHLRQPRSLGM